MRKSEIYLPVIDPASVAANTVARQSFTVSGLLPTDILTITPPALTAGFALISYRPSSTHVAELTFYNSTGGAIDEPSATYQMMVIRR